MWARRIVVVVVVVAQLTFVVRAYHSPHKEFGFQMFPESSTWQAEIVRVTDDGRRIPISEPWDGYTWSQLVRVRGLSRPSVRHHADAGEVQLGLGPVGKVSQPIGAVVLQRPHRRPRKSARQLQPLKA